ncbi:Cu(2+)-transporting P-type ATPase [Yamadazyma tenuis]|uniref:P-type Cu(+) transporter n=1 Tax=Candida tenuis (strain ATCC 10573 / BCRC 21748 / CBS 615 / JCM 9827 / NBRC 10315 / NRRL Y-1498 / VKM Y-70) TaxID=590646 RepID=G3AZ05_CANTC|nr:heavy metal translocatin [Yamadazyma tenuis ATCC 10573]EGV65974.1 heavy metal translocatin [Yamadazyma tenuis ATCC 10573]WEJ95688.1 Cu(2+)-transporting P-type ATPase [Yamadazyma tenuis]
MTDESMSKLVVQISGMTCGACSASITSAVSQLDGVSEVSVSLITEEGLVKFDHNKITSKQIIDTIEDCGFDANSVSESLLGSSDLQDSLITSVSIQGMTCGACSASITTSLENINGVSEVSVNLITEDGKITHDVSVTPEMIVGAIEDCGFDASITGSEQANVSHNTLTQSTIAITGMTCGSCSASITKALELLPGVSAVTVSLLTEEAVIKYTESQISVQELLETIENCGFDARLESSKSLGIVENDEEVIALQIYGLGEGVDVHDFQYNIEALFKSFGSGIVSFQLNVDSNVYDVMNTHGNDVTESLVNPRSRDSDVVEDGDHLINELTIVYNSSIIGVRDLIEKLDTIDPNISFLILNSVDQSSNMQLKLLSKTKEISYWRSNFFWCLVVGAPVLVLSKTQNTHFWKTKVIFAGLFWTTFIQGVLASYVQFKLGITFLKKFVQFVRNRGSGATMDILVCISTMISYLFSVLSTVVCVWNGTTSKPPLVLFDTSTMIILYISIGKWLENRAKGATSTALSKLISLTPGNCVIVSDIPKYESYLQSLRQEKAGETKLEEGENFPTKTIEIDLVQKNDIAIVLPGAKVPADGEIIFGDSEIDESLLTGESLPVYKKVGDKVIGGSVNGPGLLHVQVTKIGKNSQLQKIIKLVKESQMSKAPVQRYSDYIASRFVPCILILAFLTFAFWVGFCFMKSSPLPKVFQMEENGKFFVCLKLAISVIVVACPCALGLASPTAIMVGTGLAAKNGVLIKGGDILEKASDLHIILFDKTGTLTTGQMSLSSYKILNQKISDFDWWQLIGGLESSSEHPIAKALMKISRKQLGMFAEDNFAPMLKNFESLTGLGVKGELIYNKETFNLILGNKRLLELSSIQMDEIESTNTLLYVIINNECHGYIELSDEIKPSAKSVVSYLKHKKYIVGMVTGDNYKVAEKVGKELGIIKSNIFSEVSPLHKDKIVTDLRNKFGGPSNVKISFVGDGINDAPALSQADIGIAISNGTEIAIESADMVIMNESNDILGIPIALDISQKTFRKIKMNFVWAMIYNIFMVPFAMGCFLPLGIVLPPMAAGLAMAFSSISVVLSSLMLNRWKFDFKPDYDYKVDYENFMEFDLKGFDVDDFNRFTK